MWTQNERFFIFQVVTYTEAYLRRCHASMIECFLIFAKGSLTDVLNSPKYVFAICIFLKCSIIFLGIFSQYKMDKHQICVHNRSDGSFHPLESSGSKPKTEYSHQREKGQW